MERKIKSNMYSPMPELAAFGDFTFGAFGDFTFGAFRG